MGLYQNYKLRKEKASIFMETMNGQDITITFSVKEQAGSPANEGRRGCASKRWKTPSQLRRDKSRREKCIAKKMEDARILDNTAQEKKTGALIVEPNDEFHMDEIEPEFCEKVFVIPRHKINNHNIGIEYDVTDKLEAKGIKVIKVRVERSDGTLRGDFVRCDVDIEPTDVNQIENVNLGIVNCCVLPYT